MDELSAESVAAQRWYRCPGCGKHLERDPGFEAITQGWSYCSATGKDVQLERLDGPQHNARVLPPGEGAS
jgi:hypothetical protein